jgi:hypothetical protein
MGMKTRRLPLPEPDFFALAKNRRARQVEVGRPRPNPREPFRPLRQSRAREKFIQTFIAERDDR